MFSILPKHSATYPANGIGSILFADIHVDLLKPGFGYFNTNEVTEELRNSGYDYIIGAVNKETIDASTFNMALPLRTVRLYHLQEDGSELNGPKLESVRGKYIFIEADNDILSSDLEDAVAFLVNKNLIPVLTKAETYSCLLDNYRNIHRISTLGCLLQTDMNSLLGTNGAEAKRLAQKLLKDEDVSFIGSGARNADEQMMINELFLSKRLQKLLSSSQIKNKEIL
ncbi:CpsB/CapC family capsule biosynthesis tyrosine phosphatase [Olivibacter sp. XZL3]|uniref:CpsB/CapC family capsule biosynthesis tyrosine phosphatase n=1 Tax=Olivibacter sp. XZL3 TaxID=1735116 RepID=UPI00106465D0|nr:CpsB/CapC family capsule biosynthesis tyrosine phosphatase [Olivibacter sp. XZL3]